jgi:Fic family protein
MEQFERELVDWDRVRLTTPVEYAAWIEQRFDHQLHPLYDGCGRVARAHAMAALIPAGILYPQFPNRDEYLAERGRELPLWTEYYRSLCSS